MPCERGSRTSRLDPARPPAVPWLHGPDRCGVDRTRADLSVFLFGLNPRKRFTCVLFYHWFELDSPRDALYNAGAIPIRRDPTGASGSEVATELDILWTWNFAKNHFVGAEIMRWWSGSFIEATGDPDDAWRAWLGYELRY